MSEKQKKILIWMMLSSLLMVMLFTYAGCDNRAGLLFGISEDTMQNVNNFMMAVRGGIIFLFILDFLLAIYFKKTSKDMHERRGVEQAEFWLLAITLGLFLVSYPVHFILALSSR